MSFKDPFWPDERPKSKGESVMVVGIWFLAVMGCILFWGAVAGWLFS